MASSRFLRSQFRVSGFVSDGRVNGAWVVEWKVVETGPKSPKKRLFIAIFWSIPTLASKLLTVVVERVTKNWRPNFQWILQ